MTTLHPNEITRLSNLLGMTGSSHDGEALNAVRLANALLAKHHLTWPAVITAPTDATTAPPESAPDAMVPPHHIEAENILATAPGALTTFERNFLVGIFSFETLSDKQAATLRGIRLKVAGVSARESA
jgi:hypothetical protein